MTLRAVLMSLLVACLFCNLSAASQPDRLAARLVTNPFVPPGPIDETGLPPVACVASFAWYQDLNPRVVDPPDTVTLEMAIIPLRSGRTELILVDSYFDFARLEFRNGSVMGLPYDRFVWNDVAVQLRPATQDYVITVNGASAGPFAYDERCRNQGGCSALKGFIFRGIGGQGGEDAWIDTLSIFRESTAGREDFFKADFDHPCATLFQTTGGILIENPPPSTRPRR